MCVTHRSYTCSLSDCSITLMCTQVPRFLKLYLKEAYDFFGGIDDRKLESSLSEVTCMFCSNGYWDRKTTITIDILCDRCLGMDVLINGWLLACTELIHSKYIRYRDSLHLTRPWRISRSQTNTDTISSFPLCNCHFLRYNKHT